MKVSEFGSEMIMKETYMIRKQISDAYFKSVKTMETGLTWRIRNQGQSVVVHKLLSIWWIQINLKAIPYTTTLEQKSKLVTANNIFLTVRIKQIHLEWIMFSHVSSSAQQFWVWNFHDLLEIIWVYDLLKHVWNRDLFRDITQFLLLQTNNKFICWR